MKHVARYLVAGLLVGLGAAACGSASDGEPAASSGSELAACAAPSQPTGTVTPVCTATVTSGSYAKQTRYHSSCRVDYGYTNPAYWATCQFSCDCGATIAAKTPSCPGGGSLGTNSAGPCTPPVGSPSSYNSGNFTWEILVASCDDAADETACQASVNAKEAADPSGTRCVVKDADGKGGGFCMITPKGNPMVCCSAPDAGAGSTGATPSASPSPVSM
jgi:hypothetical protein